MTSDSSELAIPRSIFFHYGAGGKMVPRADGGCEAPLPETEAQNGRPPQQSAPKPYNGVFQAIKLPRQKFTILAHIPRVLKAAALMGTDTG